MDSVILALSILWRRLWLFLILFLIIVVGGVAGVYVKRAAYESSAKLLVNLEGLSVSLSEAEFPQVGPQVQAIEAITSQVELLTSKQLIEEMVNRLGLETFRSPPPSNPIVRFAVDTLNGATRAVSRGLARVGLIELIGEREEIVETLQNSLRVYPVRQSQIIVVSLRWRNPSVPPLALRTLLDLFLARVEEIDTKKSEYGLFTEQVTLASEALNAAETELQEFRAKHDIADLAREKEMLIDRIDRLTAMGADFLDEGGADAPEDSPGASVEGVDKDRGGVVSQLSELHSRLNALHVERARAVTTFTAQHRAVREIDSQIAATEATLQRENTRLRNMVIAARERLRVLQEAEQNYNRIGRNMDIATQAYQTYRKVARDRALMLAYETTVQIRVVDPPDQPLRATGPSRLIWAMLVLVIALAVSALCVLGIEALSRRRRVEPTAAAEA